MPRVSTPPFLCAGVAEEIVEVQRLSDHRQPALRRARPVLAGAIPVQLDAVAIRVAEVERFADAMVAGAFEGDVGGDEALERIGERGAGWIKDREVIEASRAGRRRGSAFALPGVEADVVMVAARGEEGGAS